MCNTFTCTIVYVTAEVKQELNNGQCLSGIVRGVISVDEKLVQSQRIDEMKVFGGTLIARVMESDTLFDNFCVKYVGAIDNTFSREFVQ